MSKQSTKKKKNAIPFPFPKLIKKSSTFGLILLLAWTLIQLGDGIYSTQSEPVKLPSSNEPVELYSNQTKDNLTRLFTDSIKSAQHSVTLSIYALIDENIVNALQGKSNEGIPVFIVCDAKASPGITRKLPNATVIRRTGLGLMHQKILVIDEKQIIVGSANFTYSSLNIHGNLVLGLENSALAQSLCSRIKSMDEDGTPLPSFYRETMADSQKVEFWMLPNDPDAVNRLIQLFRSAQKTIRVAMFTWTRIDFTQELIAAAARGVKVETVLDRYAGKGASAKIVDMLAKAKIFVGLSTGKGLLHHKFAIIDDKLVCGSANWTANAFKNNDDYLVIIDPLTTDQKAKLNLLWEEIRKQSACPNGRSKKK